MPLKQSELNEYINWLNTEYNYRKVKDGAAIAAFSFQSMIDEQAKNLGIPEAASCKKGCVFCCYINVTISLHEAIGLVISAFSNGIKIPVEKLKRQAMFAGERWGNQAREDQKCMFLDQEEKVCRVYDDRPSACRSYFVASDPKLCDTSEKNGNKVLIMQADSIDLIKNTVLHSSASGSMPVMIIQALRVLSRIHQATEIPDNLKNKPMQDGMVIPAYATKKKDGPYDFSSTTPEKWASQNDGECCAICDKKIPRKKFRREAYIVIDEKSFESRTTSDIPMHEHCARYSFVYQKNNIGPLFLVKADTFKKSKDGKQELSFKILGAHRYEFHEGRYVPSIEKFNI